MTTRLQRMLCISAIILMVTVGLGPLLPTASATNDPANTHAHVDVVGDWIVLDTRTYDGGTSIHMTNGNVRVADGGVLTLDQAGITFSSASNGQRGIVVEDGGTLIVRNGGGFQSSTGFSYYVGFLANSTITISGAITFVAGGTAPGAPFGAGVYIGTTNITINGWTLQNNPMNDRPYIMSDAPGIVYKNMTMQVQNQAGIEFREDGTAYDTIITGLGGNIKYGIRVANEVSATIINGRLGPALSYGALVNGGTLDIRNVKIHNNTQAGLSVNQGGSVAMQDCEVTDNSLGVAITDFSTGKLTGNNRIMFNPGTGIGIGNAASVDITGARISQNPSMNMGIYGASTASVEKSLFEDFGTNSNIYLESVSSLTMKNSTVRAGGSEQQLLANSGSEVVLTGNNFLGDTTFAVSAVNAAEVTADKNTFVGCGLCLSSFTMANIYSSSNTFTDWTAIPFATIGGELFSTGDSGKTAVSSSVFWSFNYGTVEIVKGNFIMATAPNSIGAAESFGEAYLTDCQFTTSATNPLLFADNGYVLAINSGVPVALTQANNGGIIDLGWHVDVETGWQNGEEAPQAAVKFIDANGTIMNELVTDDQGLGSLDVIETTTTDAEIIWHNPFNVTAELNGMMGNVTAKVIKNLEGPASIVVLIKDTSAPVVDIVFPVEGYMTADGHMTINGTASDVGSLLEGVYVKVDDGAFVKAVGLADWKLDLDLTEDAHDLLVEARDIAGMTKSATVSVIVDQTAPELTITGPAGLYLRNTKFYLNGTTEPDAKVEVDGQPVSVDANGNFSFMFDLADGEYNMTVTSMDAVGNTATAHKLVIIDTVAPTVSCDIADGAWYITNEMTLTGKTSGVTVMVSGSAATVDLKNGTWSKKVTLVEGINTFLITATDLAGNNATIPRKVQLDTVKPVITVVAPAGAGPLYTNKATINVTGSVTELELLSLTLGGTAVTVDVKGNFTQTVTLTEGSNSLTLVAKDKAGNEAKWEYTVIKDTKAPVIEITTPKNGLVTNAASVQVTGKVDDSTASLKFGTSNLTNTNGTFTTTAALVNGANTVSVTATDLAGNSATASITVTQDTVCNFVVTKPTKMKVTKSSDSLTLTGTSEPGATVYVNGAAIPTSTDGSFTYKLILKEGSNTFALKAVDAAGNEKSDTLKVTYNDEKQFAMSMLLILGIVFMIIGLIVGLVVGMAMAKRKAPPQDQDEYPSAPARTEEKPFTPEEEPEDEPEPAPPKEEPKAAPKPEPKPEPKAEPKATPKAETKPAPAPQETKKDNSLDDLLKNLEKK